MNLVDGLGALHAQDAQIAIDAPGEPGEDAAGAELERDLRVLSVNSAESINKVQAFLEES